MFAGIFTALGFTVWEIGQRGARAYEDMLAERVMNGLDVLGYSWAEIRTDGLRMDLLGHAPDTFERELAYEAAKAAVPAAEITNFATATLAPPEQRDPVRVEIHRDKRGITMTGQTASRTMRKNLNDALAAQNAKVKVQDLTGIQAALPRRRLTAEIAVVALAAVRLPNAYVLMEPGKVTVEGQSPNAEARDALTKALTRAGRDAVALDLRLRIPANVIAPFVFAAERDLGLGLMVERCAARSEAEQAQILAVLRRAGADLTAEACPIGLGGPAGDWSGAIGAALAALQALQAGRAEVEYRAVSLTGFTPTAQKVFEDAKATLTDGLPDGFELRARLDGDDIATQTAVARDLFWLHIGLQDETLSLGGIMPDRTGVDAVETYAKAMFPDRPVKAALSVSPGPAPDHWQSAAMQILQHLRQAGRADVHLAGFKVSVTATLEDPRLARFIHESLTQALPDYAVKTAVQIDLPASLDGIPLPGPRCAERLNRIYVTQPINFDTGSARIAKDSDAVLDRLAKILINCDADQIEIGGHTDAQGTEAVNLRISQARADAVAEALAARGVPRALMAGKGYGEAVPIADNATERGRARNRRIEFRAVARKSEAPVSDAKASDPDPAVQSEDP